MRKLVATVFILLAATGLAGAQPAPPPDALRDLAPTGKLRAAINFGNGVLAQKGPNGEPKGITPDLATALAKKLGVAVEFVRYEAAGKVFDSATKNE
jgi:polar amino acid transport system substrate-binding protein